VIHFPFFSDKPADNVGLKTKPPTLLYVGGFFMSKLKRTTEEAKAYFAEQGCELLGEYVGCMQKMKYRCKCGSISEINWNHFSRGKRCGNCAKYGLSKKRTVEQVREIFKERGCEFLDDEFKSIQHKHNYRCSCGTVSQISFAAFHYQNQTCYECGLKKNLGPNHHMWIEDRELARQNKLFRKKCYKAVRATLLATEQEKVGSTTELIGYTPKQLQEHITNHPNWKKVKNGDWHLDHIFPIQAFLDCGIKDMALINCLENLQPISGRENDSKGAKYNKKSFEKWLRKNGRI
jgi:5-methylcytosine-specific restriction endonuclease McrA